MNWARLLFFLMGVCFACGNEAVQTLMDIKAPCARTFTIALDARNQANVREAKFSLVAFPGDLKDNVGAYPLGLVFDKADLTFRGMPHNFTVRHELADFVGTAVDICVAIGKLVAKFVGIPFNLSRPPATHIVDG